MMAYNIVYEILIDRWVEYNIGLHSRYNKQ